MSKSLHIDRATARQNEAALLSAIAEVGQVNVADSLGIESSTISKWKAEGRLNQFAELLTVLNFKVVDANSTVASPGDVVISADELRAMETLTAKYLDAKLNGAILVCGRWTLPRWLSGLFVRGGK